MLRLFSEKFETVLADVSGGGGAGGGMGAFATSSATLPTNDLESCLRGTIWGSRWGASSCGGTRLDGARSRCGPVELSLPANAGFSRWWWTISHEVLLRLSAPVLRLPLAFLPTKLISKVKLFCFHQYLINLSSISTRLLSRKSRFICRCNRLEESIQLQIHRETMVFNFSIWKWEQNEKVIQFSKDLNDL